ncbi:MAG: hypothetical protein J7M05_02195 [Anaerolineae bacterium]|nr:hypothetical protein [Anaerolineae bacterium]
MREEKRQRGLFWGLFGLFALAFLAWEWQSLQTFSWEYDEGLNLAKAKLLTEGYSLYRQVWSDQLPLFTLLLAGAFKFCSPSVFLGRLLVLGLALLGAGGLGLIIRKMSSWPAALWGVVVLFLLPHFQELSSRVLIGLPAISLANVALFFSLCQWPNPRLRNALGAGVAFAISLLIKPLTAPLIVPLGGAVFLWPKVRKGPWERLRYLLTFLLATGGVCVGVLMWFHLPSLWDQVGRTLFHAREASGFSFRENLNILVRYLFRDKWGLSYGALLLLAVAGGAALLRGRRWREAAYLGLWFASVVGALLWHSPLRRHELFLLYPPLMVASAIGFDWMLQSASRLKRSSWRDRGLFWVAIGGVLWLILGVPQWLCVVERQRTWEDSSETRARYEAVEFLRHRTRVQGMVITDDPMLAFKAGRRIPPWLAVPSARRIEAGKLTAEELIRLAERVHPEAILFWEERLTRLPEFVRWVRQRYVAVRAYEDARWIYLSKERVSISFPQPAFSPKGVVFLGSEIEHLGVDRGGTLEISLFWQARGRIRDDYTLFVHLLDKEGHRWAQSDLRPLDGWYPSSRWTVGETIAQEVHLRVPSVIPEGEKLLAVGLYDARKHRVPLYDGKGARLAGDQVILSAHPVVHWDSLPSFSVPMYMVGAFLGEKVVLWGYELDSRRLVPGAVLEVRLLWRCLQETRTSYTGFVHLLSPEGRLLAQDDHVPGNGKYPTTGWLPGDVIVDVYRISLPKNLKEGTYILTAGMYGPFGERLPVYKGTWVVPERRILLATLTY